jgi:hypothetical protein
LCCEILGISRRFKAVKRCTFVSVLCALLFANMLVVATAEEIEKLSIKCAHGDHKACEKLRIAVGELTDQALLAKIALEETDANIRKTAVLKLTDQGLLWKITVRDNDESVRLAAVGKLTDQAQLALTATMNMNPDVGEAAVQKLTDQAILARVAVNATDWNVRSAAVKKLTDQALLSRIAVEDKNSGVSLTAIDKMNDQMLLAKIAIGNNSPVVREAVFRKLTNQALLARLAAEDMNRDVRLRAIAAMDESNPALKRFAGNLHESSFNPIESIARIKLAIQDPRIRNRFPGILLTVSYSSTDKAYGPQGSIIATKWISGESVSFALNQTGRVLANRNWKTVFSDTLTIPFFSRAQSDTIFRPAEVHGEELLAELLRNAEFTQDDLTELSTSEIPELCLGAVAALTDQTLLTKIALEALTTDARIAALKKLTDQALLVRIAGEDNDLSVRKAAEKKLSDLRSMSILAVEAQTPSARIAALKMVTDQALLAKIAVEDQDSNVRITAVAELTDQTLLAKIAADDKEPIVRWTAKQRLDWIRKNTK